MRLSAFSRALLLGFVAERRLQLTLRMLNERIKLALPETLAPSDGGGPAAVALEDDVHGGARLWRRPLGAGSPCPTLLGALPGALLWSQLDDALLADKFSEPVDWSPPADLEARLPAQRERGPGWVEALAGREDLEGGTWREGGPGGREGLDGWKARGLGRPSCGPCLPLPPPGHENENKQAGYKHV